MTHLHECCLCDNARGMCARLDSTQVSIADFQVLDNHKDVLAWSLYIAKDFELKEHERPTYRRYHSAHGYQPKPVKLKGLTKEQILEIAQEQAALHGSELHQWDGSDAWCPKGYFWTVSTCKN